MARRGEPTRLDVWMNGIPVGQWETTRRGERFAYFKEWLT